MSDEGKIDTIDKKINEVILSINDNYNDHSAIFIFSREIIEHEQFNKFRAYLLGKKYIIKLHYRATDVLLNIIWNEVGYNEKIKAKNTCRKKYHTYEIFCVIGMILIILAILGSFIYFLMKM